MQKTYFHHTGCNKSQICSFIITIIAWRKALDIIILVFQGKQDQKLDEQITFKLILRTNHRVSSWPLNCSLNTYNSQTMKKPGVLSYKYLRGSCVGGGEGRGEGSLGIFPA